MGKYYPERFFRVREAIESLILDKGGGASPIVPLWAREMQVYEKVLRIGDRDLYSGLGGGILPVTESLRSSEAPQVGKGHEASLSERVPPSGRYPPKAIEPHAAALPWGFIVSESRMRGSCVGPRSVLQWPCM